MIADKWPCITQSDIQAVINQLELGELSSAGKTEVINELETKFCNLTDCKYALAMSSGTMALYSSLLALGIKEGDEVVVPIYAYHAVASPLIAINAIPVFADIDEDYAHISIDTINKCITQKTKAIIVVHSYGYALDMDPISELARAYNLKVIEDCSHAHGASYKGKSVGGLADIGFFSLQAAKLVPAGEGGILVTNDKSIYEKTLLLGHHFDRTSLEVENKYYRNFINTGLGLKLRINPLGAALANSQFDRLHQYISERNDTYKYIAEQLRDLPEIEPIFPQDYMTTSTYYSYRFKFIKKSKEQFDTFLNKVRSGGISVSKPSALPLSDENLFAMEEYDFGLIKKRKCNSSRLDYDNYQGVKQYLESVFRIPTYYDSKKDIDNMICVIRSVCEKKY